MDKEKPKDSMEMEVIPPSTMMALERAAIDSQVATAHAYPRSLELFQRRALSMATLDLATAESCIYARPVGNGKIAEGASIRLAEIVAASYGNLRVASRIVEQTERSVKCEGFAWDLESNYGGKSEVIEPTVQRSGEPYSESQRMVAAKACLAKAYRDAVFKVVPRALCKSVIDAAIGVIRKQVVTLEDRRKRVKDWLKSIKIEDKRVFGILKVNGWSEVTDEHLIMLTGLRTALNEGETTIDEAFPIVLSKPLFEVKKPAEAAPPADAAPVETPKPEPPKKGSKLDQVLLLCGTDNIDPLLLIDFLSQIGLISPGQTLQELADSSPSTLDTVIDRWKDIANRVKQNQAIAE